MRPAALPPGLPRISDGQLLFLLHMLAHRKEPKEGGSRIAIIMNGSPLFTGDAGSGESEIRRWILENDLLEALIALPEQLFYNTGIATYVWVLTNRKAPSARAKFSSSTRPRFWVPMRKSLGDKRREIPLNAPEDIVEHPHAFKDGTTSVTVTKDGRTEEIRRQQDISHHSLRLPEDHGRAAAPANFQASARAVGAAGRGTGIPSLAQSKKKGAAKAKEEAEGERAGSDPGASGHAPGTLFKDRGEFERALEDAAGKAGIKLSAPVVKAILSALSRAR